MYPIKLIIKTYIQNINDQNRLVDLELNKLYYYFIIITVIIIS